MKLAASLEQQLHESVASQELDETIVTATSSQETAVAKLAGLANRSEPTGEGPLAISHSADFGNNDWLATAAQCYLNAFETNKQSFPYIKANS